MLYLPPNLRVQRTRAYASLRRSPLTRRPLGGQITKVAARRVLAGLANASQRRAGLVARRPTSSGCRET